MLAMTQVACGKGTHAVRANRGGNGAVTIDG